MNREVVVSGGFDDLRSRDLRFLEEAAKLGELTVLLWPDEMLCRLGRPPKFPFPERLYLLNAVRYIRRVLSFPAELELDTLPQLEGFRPQLWVDFEQKEASAARRDFCRRHGLQYAVLPASRLQGFPEPQPQASLPGRKKVVVTGCYDWFHSGHVRFCEEVSAYGDLYVVVGHDANIRLLKGEGHPLFPQAERRYLVEAIKYVKQALISTGHGWLDADPEIRRLKPDIYAVNQDGDKGGKREYCEKLGIEYLVLKRAPAPGLPARTSTNLRGF